VVLGRLLAFSADRALPLLLLAWMLLRVCCGLVGVGEIKAAESTASYGCWSDGVEGV
jgi:hypothetical protein